MKSIELSRFLTGEIKPFLLGALLSRITEKNINGQKYFDIYSYYKKSIFLPNINIHLYSDDYVNTLIKLSGYDNWFVTSDKTKNYLEVHFLIKNDLDMTNKQFFIEIYKKIMHFNWNETIELDEDRKNFIRGYFELRGSVDTSAKYLSQDYFYNNVTELHKCKILYFKMNVESRFLNINPRELQPQFVNDEIKRNTQFRINLFYYAKNIGFISKYKAEIFQAAYSNEIEGKFDKDGRTYFNCQLPAAQYRTETFISMLNFFTNNVYEKELTPKRVKQLRSKLGFDKKTTGRDRSLVDLFEEISPDICASCGKTKTHTSVKTGRQKFEIHHMISLANDFELDQMPNLVKLCPDCHSALGKGAAPKEEQINIIKKILNNQPQVYDFTSIYLGITDLDHLALAIQQKLA